MTGLKRKMIWKLLVLMRIMEIGENILISSLLLQMVKLIMDFLIDGQISSFCPDQLEAMLLTLTMQNKIPQSL
jgi:hypothetical protein